MDQAMHSNTEHDYTVTISVKKSPSEVYAAINNVSDWWVGDVTGQALKVGDTFTYRYKEFHESRQKVTELAPNKKVVWAVEAASISFAQKKHEWVGTEIVFEIIERGEHTDVRFTHRGLTPKFECYKDCSGGWDFYITKSLVSYITTGKGINPGF